jgi:hypothetical protein
VFVDLNLGGHLTMLRNADQCAKYSVSSKILVTEISDNFQDSKHRRADQLGFEWMRAVLQKDVSLGALRDAVGDVGDLKTLLHRLYDGRLSDRNRSMVILASRYGLRRAIVCRFLGIDRKTHSRYLRTFEKGGQQALFARQTRSTRKFDNKNVKQMVFGLLHEPPSNYGINRTAWIMSDLVRILRESGQPACQVIRRITKAAGYRWRKARVVLTSADPEYTKKLDAFARFLRAFVRMKPSSQSMSSAHLP